MVRLFQFYMLKSCIGSLTMWQRLLGLQYGIAVLLSPIVAVINMCLTPVYLVTGVPLVYFHNLQTFRLLLRMECVAIFLTWIHDCNLGVFSSMHLAIREGGTLYMSPCKFNSVMPLSVGKYSLQRAYRRFRLRNCNFALVCPPKKLWRYPA